jgi:hypothetical protein
VSRRLRMRTEAALAVVSAVLVVVTLIWPTWFERLLDASPDGGSGSAERWFALAWLMGSVGFALLARRDRRALAQ